MAQTIPQPEPGSWHPRGAGLSSSIPKKLSVKTLLSSQQRAWARCHGAGTLWGHLERAQGHLAASPRGFGVVGAAPQGGGDSIKPSNPRCLQHPPADNTPSASLMNMHQLTPCPPPVTPEAAGSRNWMDCEASRGWGRLRGDEGSQSKARRRRTGHKARSIVPLLLQPLGHQPGLEGRGRGQEGSAGRQSSPDLAARLWNLQSGQHHGKARKVHPGCRQKRSCERHDGTRRAPAEPPLHRERNSWEDPSAGQDGILPPGLS